MAMIYSMAMTVKAKTTIMAMNICPYESAAYRESVHSPNSMA
jgi:hypothetical protein